MFYPSVKELTAAQLRGVDIDLIYPHPIRLNECVMVVVAEDLKRLQAAPIDDRVYDTDCKQTTSEIKSSEDFSLLFKDMKRKDDWYRVICDIAKTFYDEHGRLPGEVEALTILNKKLIRYQLVVTGAKIALRWRDASFYPYHHLKNDGVNIPTIAVDKDE